MPVAGEAREVLDIPEGVKVNFDTKTSTLGIKGPLGSLSRKFVHPKLKIETKNKNIQLFCDLPRKKDLALFGTWLAHIKNMLKGVTDGFEYKMKIVYAHFPIKTRVQDEFVMIENFLGEKQPRKAKIVGETKVKISGDQIILNGIDLEQVSQSAANIELATRIKNFDPRIFQDGIYITEKSTKP
jgi:large subunit ribosomal protein L6